jgi:flagellar basal body-associated protein FliL
MSVSDDVTLVAEETPLDLEAGKSRNRWILWAVLAFVAAFVVGFISVRSASKKEAEPQASPAGTESS